MSRYELLSNVPEKKQNRREHEPESLLPAVITHSRKYSSENKQAAASEQRRELLASCLSGSHLGPQVASAPAVIPGGRRAKTVPFVFCGGRNPAAMRPDACGEAQGAQGWYLGAGAGAVHVLGPKDLGVDAAEVLQLRLSKDSPHPANTEDVREEEA